MGATDKLADLVFDLQKQVARQGASAQMANTTVGGDAAVPVSDVVEESVVTNDALPDVQQDSSDGNEGVSDLQANLSAIDADLNARFEDARAELEDKAVEIADAMSEIETTFGAQYDGLSEDVETAIQAAGSAKTEAEAATDAARDAAGLAESKGETIYQVSAPAGSRASTANLWIDITPDANGVPKNAPNRYVDLGPDTITNALPNPAFRNGLTGYSVEPAITATQQTDGTVRVITKDGQSQSFVIGGIQNAPYTLVVVGRAFQGGRPAIYGGNPQGQQVPLTDAWATYYVDITQTDTNGNLYLAVVSPGGEPTNGFDLRGLMLVPGTGYRGPYSDGTTAGWKWTGTADASASTYTGPKWVPVTDQKALDAAAAASTATAAAQAAKDVATQANTAAGVAQQAASDANTAALAAANLAGGKGKIIYQASKPTGANAAVGNLWIRSSDNTPWAYDSSSSDWVQVTDKAATDAAAAAAAANQAAVAASNAAKAAQATADSKPLILYSSTAGPSGTAPTGSIWFLWDSAKNVAGQWLQSGTLAAPVWTPQQIRSEVIANLDVAKLTAGSAAIADLVAQKIAAATGNFQTVNVSNLFVTSGATMSQAVIDYLFANVVQAKKITAGMIDVSTLNGVTITGALFKSAVSGQRIEMLQTRLDIYNSSDALSGRIFGGLNNGIVTGASLVLQAINGSKSGQFLIAAPLDVSCSVSPAPYVLPGFTYTGTTLKGTISAVAEGLVVKGPLLADEIWYAGDNRRALGPANQSTPNGNRVVLAATVDRLNYAYAKGSTGVRTDVPVMTGDPYGDTANVYLSATDFRTPAGVSHGLGDTGWINITPSNGWANQSGTRLRYRVRHGVFYLQGYLNSANTTATTFATIPSDYTPSQNIRVPATNGTGSSGTWMDFPVGADGTLAANTARNPNFAVSWPLDQ